MVPELIKIVTDWFNNYSTEKLMSCQQLSEFISKCTGVKCNIDNNKVTHTFTQFDHDNDGFLTLSDFIAFYTYACKDRLDAVWKNLQAFNFRNDLKKEDQVEIE